jgi:mono/diheme cytochrome c family protein
VNLKIVNLKIGVRPLSTAVAVLLLAPLTTFAQAFLNDRQLLGMRLYNQSCRVCHTKPQLTSPQYAPVLSRASLNGNDDALRASIANGSAKMPGFRYHFKPAEIDAIVSYLKTVPPPAD